MNFTVNAPAGRAADAGTELARKMPHAEVGELSAFLIAALAELEGHSGSIVVVRPKKAMAESGLYRDRLA